MKYLIISDTHKKISRAIDEITNEKPDYCIHLGDMAEDCEDLQRIFPMQKFIFVKGNNDYFLKSSLFPDERLFTLEGKKFFLCHGHKYYVKMDYSYIKKIAREKNADIVLFGHTHIPHLETDGKITLMNPGSVSSYGIIEIKDGKVFSSIKDA